MADQDSVTLREYGNYAIVTKRMLHFSMGYVCPEKDTCEICNWKPTPLTAKQKRQEIYRKIKWRLGKPLGDLALKLGYINYECEEDD